LLRTARESVRQVNPLRLGGIGSISDYAYVAATGFVEFGATEPKAEIPVLVEA
jgi:hypothetical protein